MERKKEKLEDFKTDISTTVRSITNLKKIEVFFVNQSLNLDKSFKKLPEIINDNNTINYEEIRAEADSKSLRLRFSDKDIFKKYEPDGNISKKLYSIAEKIRCEKIGTSYFKGIKNNIEKFYQKRVSGLDLKSSEDKISESFENYLRVKFLSFKNESQLDNKLKTYKKELNNKFKDKLDQLENFALNQEKYNSLISELISNMSLDENVNNEEKREEETKKKRNKIVLSMTSKKLMIENLKRKKCQLIQECLI